jgi:hypothetical protein
MPNADDIADYVWTPIVENSRACGMDRTDSQQWLGGGLVGTRCRDPVYAQGELPYTSPYAW